MRSSSICLFSYKNILKYILIAVILIIRNWYSVSDRIKGKILTYFSTF